MINTAQALNEFWNGFGIPAYMVNTVPDEQPDGKPTEPPYITYSIVETEPLEAATHYAQVFYRGAALAALLSKVDEIKEAIGTGAIIKCNGGYVVLRPASPFVQLMIDADPDVRYAYINLQVNCYHN